MPASESDEATLPRIILTGKSISGEVTYKVNGGDSINIVAKIFPVDLGNDSLQWGITAGTFYASTEINGDLRTKKWYAPETGETVIITLTATNAGKSAVARLPIVVVGKPANKHSVTFESNGGSAVASQTVTEGGKATKPTPAPTKAGYTFVNWYKEAELNTLWAFDTDTVVEATTIYAKWDINSYAVKFNSNGGSAVDDQTIDYGTKATEPTPAPTKAGHTFDGWYKDVGLNTPWAFDTDTVVEATTIYAKWTINSYTVTFDINGGDEGPIPATKSAVYGSSLDALPTAPTKTYSYFASWNTKDDGTGSIFDATTAITADITVYAIYSDFPDGDGTESNPYHVSNADDLNNVRNHLAKYFIQTAHISLKDSDLDGHSWYDSNNGFEPIGANSAPFTGVYNGNDKKITHMKILSGVAPSAYIGLFGYTDGATLKNIYLENVNIVSDKNYVGSLVGCSKLSTITNCYNTGNVTGGNITGGLIGSVFDSTITNCYNTGSVADGNITGGLIGDCNNSIVNSCHNTGAVTGSGDSSGFIGRSYNSTISSCYNTGNLTNKNESNGGFISESENSTINNCYNTGNILGAVVEGNCGFIKTLYEYEANTFSNCYSSGSVVGTNSYGFTASTTGGTFTNNFYDRTTSGLADTKGATPKTTAEMKTATTFTSAGWDTAIWNITDGAYPTLK